MTEFRPELTILARKSGNPGFPKNPKLFSGNPKKTPQNLVITQEKSIICPNSSTFQCFFDNLSKKHRKAEELGLILKFSINYGFLGPIPGNLDFRVSRMLHSGASQNSRILAPGNSEIWLLKLAQIIGSRTLHSGAFQNFTKFWYLETR